MSENVDLFGDPIPDPKGRGRPTYVPTQLARDKVAMLLAFGWSNERIANAIMISLPTLRRAFRVELKVRTIMRDRLDARVAEKLMEGVNAGNVGAIKEFRKLLERNDQMSSERSFLERAKTDQAPAKAEEKLGKKAQRQMNAEKQTGNGRFAVPPSPKMVQ